MRAIRFLKIFLSLLASQRLFVPDQNFIQYHVIWVELLFGEKS